MSWARLDDHFHDHPKVMAKSLAAVGLYALGLSYCADQSTEGFIPAQVVMGWDRWRAASDELLEGPALWERADGGYRVHDYLDWNPSRRKNAEQQQQQQTRKNARILAAKNERSNGVRNASGSSPASVERNAT